MIPAMALVAAAVLAGVCGPRALSALARRTREPTAALAGWIGTMLGVVLTVIVAVVLLALPGHGDVNLMNACWSALRHGAFPPREQLTAVVAVGLLLALTARLLTVLLSQYRRRKQRRDRVRSLATLTASPPLRRRNLVWIEHPGAIAFSISGRPSFVVISDGARKVMTPKALAATLDHERAHLQGHHQLLIDTVDALARALPFIPLFKAAPDAVRELVELCADNYAARRHGTAAVYQALLAFSSGIGDPARADGLAMAHNAVERRLNRLQQAPTPVRAPGRILRVAGTSTVALVLPPLIGFGSLYSVACT